MGKVLFKNKKIGFLLVVLIIILTFLGAYFYLLYQKEKAKEIILIGIIRNSGLQDEEKNYLRNTLGEKDNFDYQITHLNLNNNEARGYYLISAKINEQWLGKCVKIGGYIPKKWEKNKSDVYGYKPLKVVAVQKLKMEECNPYFGTNSSDTYEGEITLKGTLTHQKRPSPDIGYDYNLILKEPFFDELNAVGPTNLKEIVASPSNKEIWIKMENLIGKEITVKGYLKWGYSESRYFEVKEIEE